MPSAPARNPALVLVTVFGSFLAGPLLGFVTAHWAAPGSGLAQVVSPLAFLLAFVGGLMLWFGLGVLSMARGALSRLLRRRQDARPPRRFAEEVPPGYGAFLPLALGLGLLAGGVAGLVPQAGSLWLSFGVHLGAGAAYGGALRSLARHGYLPFPEPA